MVGYPRYTANGISFETLFNPAIGYGQQVELKSILDPACGTFVVYYLDYDLECQAPDGPWFTHVKATAPKFFVLPQKAPG
jgi:hypothetical protein